MSYASVVGEMQAIQARLVQFGVLQATTAKPATSATSATSFASALTDATSTDATAAPATTAAATTTASTDGTTIDANGVTGDDVVQAALTYKGTPYVLGGESKSGIDCSGLVQAALAKVGVSAPRLVSGQEDVGQKVDSLKDAKPGDLIVLNGGDHIAIYMGNDTVIHAPYPGRTVSVQKAWFDDSDITTIRRVVPATGDASSTSATSTASAVAAATGSAASSTGASASSSGLSAATVAKATALISTYGADVGMYDTSGSSGGTSLASVLGSFGLTGTTTATTSASSSTAAQQILAARTAMLGGTS